ncbi:SPOR domain-containing protein [Parvibaculum sp.]|uniref:SPOR domain-containing protein n=1 Tax=Parvibaculum sp. TaxID=2024848 RepID=UPI001D755C2E|nr:SPOR domain-containing protein [Parvibaculum sp.]MBX3489463.1 SPOR domain-containing protein [Parvibaculum sp.]MCW5726581.1 SPOR domain-containing protein [Parvibaculum sp.]
MFDRVQRDRFWLLLGAILIALFVIQTERGIAEPHQASQYDRSGMTRLVEKTIEIPVHAAQPAARPPLPRPQVVQTAWNDPHADLITGSLRASAPRPLARPGSSSAVTTASLAAPATLRPSGGQRYYVQLGTYTAIDRASRRYFDILGREPDLRGEERVSIDSATVGGEQVHRVRMGAFDSEASARAACARAAVPADECAVILLN